ncbi:MAG: hypothetical protein DYH08_06135 [Actinobacteria bacterium ATB1]|nr:hypothetical protein [Actinobacteria bacterium ATB1]
MSQATRQACSQAASTQVEGIGVSFTSCTILPVRDRGTPLCLSDHHFASRPHAWPKLWKHHGALEQTERMNALARARDEGWLARYGGRIGLEWFFPKVLEVIESDSEAAETTDIWIEAGGWIVWQLTGSGDTIVRSSCQAGYKALWAPDSGFPVDFLSACDPALGRAATQKAPGILAPPGTHAGGLASTFAADMGLRPGIPVSTAIIDSHAAVPGAGVAESGTLVMVLGTSGCHMVMDPGEHLVPGVAGIVADGILPGAYGYETGQAAVGDAFDWARRLCGSGGFSELGRAPPRPAPRRL